MRIALLAAAAYSLTACGAEPVRPAEPTPTAAIVEPAMPGMDDTMKAADSADDANVAETPDGYLFHTDTTKVESVHLPATPTAVWTATPVDPTQIEVVEETNAPMPDGSVHHIVKVKSRVSDFTFTM